jgi:predicted TIM-barrel fold metal-dependent hydrolase
MKLLLIISLLISLGFLGLLPQKTFAATGDELLDRLLNKLIDISLGVWSLIKQVNELINSTSSLYPLTLGDYLKQLFESHNIILDKDDFLEEIKYPYVEGAKILNLIPSSWQNNQKITQFQAKQISEKLLSIKDKILLDGLYGKIDMHEHYRAGGNIEEFLKAAGALGISKIVFVPTGLNPDNRGYKTHQKFLIKYIKKLYPEKIIPFCTIDEADPQAPEIFEECLKAGGQGLKLIGGHPSFYDVPLNSENMYKVYQIAAEYKVPVLIHASIINIPEVKEQLEQILTDFPEVTFIHAHYCSAIFKGINLDQCSELLDKYPNLYIDLSMGGGIKRYHRYFRQDLQKVKDFILTYQDRILFGSDIILNRAWQKNLDWLYQRIRCDIDLHQKQQYACQFGEKDKVHQGFNLSKEILRKLYFENPKKVLGF